jgi:hypothetical protein
MATAPHVQFRLACYARWLLIGAGTLTKHTGLRIPTAGLRPS